MTWNPNANLNEAADFWRYQIGVNVISADTKNKTIYEEWKKWQNNPIPEELHNQWKTENKFSKGMAVILGKVWHNKQKVGLYLNGIDADNSKAIEEICTYKGKAISIEELAKWTLVEQHLDDSTKAHIYVYSNRPFAKKSTENTSRAKNNDIPAIEVKGLGAHGILFCSPSIHKNGHSYQIIGTSEPIIANDFEQHIDSICRKYGVLYLTDANGDRTENDKPYRLPIEDMFKPEFNLLEGHNRHEALLRIMESLLVRNRSILSPDQIRNLAMEWNAQHCLPPLDELEFEKQWKCAVKYVATNDKQSGNDNMKNGYLTNESRIDNSDNNNNNTQAAVEIQEPLNIYESFDNKITNEDYAEFVINVIKKTVKQEDSLIRQIFYSGLSAYTNDPINLGIIAPTSEGKTYPVIESLKPFPKEDVWLIGSMSTKLLVRQKGVLVDKNNELLKPKIKALKKEIANTKNEKDKQEELKDQLEELYENARTLIDLRGKILVFLEPPQHELWNLLKPILSHDSDEIEFPFVDKTERGFQSKRIVVKGWPACIFCSAKDESEWPVWPEIVSRFLITSPNMNPAKYMESNLLIAQRKGLPSLIQQRVIVSDEEVRLARLCVLRLKQQIQTLLSTSTKPSCNSNNPVWIPYTQILAEVLPAEKGTDTRATKRIFSLLQIIPLAKAHLRHKLVLGSETLVIAALEDLGHVLHITQNISGMPSYKLKFFKDVFLPLYRSKSGPDKEERTQEEEKRIAVTTKQLCDYYKQEKGKIITTNNLKKTFLNELLNNGYIDEEDSLLDKRQKIYYPLVEFSNEINEGREEQEKITNCLTSDGVDNFMQYSKLLFPRNYINMPDNWLKLEILDLVKYPLEIDKFTLLDKHDNELCICRFEKDYEKNVRLSGYFSNAQNNNNLQRIFRDIKYLGKVDVEQYEKLSTRDEVVQFSIPTTDQAQLEGKDNDDIINHANYVERPVTKEEFRYQCYYCNYEAKYKEAYDKHVVLTHPGGPAYPNKAEIEKSGLKAQGKDWEV